MQNRRKKLNISLEQWYPLARYLGLAAAVLLYPQLQERTWLLPGGIFGSRCFMMLWAVILIGVNGFLDNSYIAAYRMDLEEEQKKVKNGGLHRKALMALAAPVMFVIDAVVIAHVYLSFIKAGAVQADSVTAGYHTAAMAAGLILWIYGRALPKVPYGSIWGIKTKKSMASQQAWGSIHLKAVPWSCCTGVLAMIGGTFLQPLPALIVAAICSAAAFVGMFTRKA